MFHLIRLLEIYDLPIFFFIQTVVNLQEKRTENPKLGMEERKPCTQSPGSLLQG
jgi:hypothetical protein